MNEATATAEQSSAVQIPAPLLAKARELALPDSLSADLLAAYAPYAVAGAAIKEKIRAAETVTPALARDWRLAMVKVRTGSDKMRRNLKEDSLLRSRAIDGLHAMIEMEAKTVEQQMEDIEKAAERAEAARVAKLIDDRLAELRPYVVSDPSCHRVEFLSDAEFSELLDSVKIAHAERARAKAEADRLAAIRAEADRLAAEAARAKAEEERLEQARKWAVEQERRRAAEVERQRVEKEAADRAKAEVQAKAERERVAREHQAAIDAAARRERELREIQEREVRRLQAEVQRAKEAEARALAAEERRKADAAESARREAERKAAAEAQAKADLAKREAAKKADAERREEVIEVIIHDLDCAKVAGMGVAFAIANGRIRHVRVDWENE